MGLHCVSPQLAVDCMRLKTDLGVRLLSAMDTKELTMIAEQDDVKSTYMMMHSVIRRP